MTMELSSNRSNSDWKERSEWADFDEKVGLLNFQYEIKDLISNISFSWD